jgi:hypothetical protein
MFMLLLASSLSVIAQEKLVVFGKIVDGDTIPVIPLREVTIYGWEMVDGPRAEKRLTRLMKNVKKVYPYAKLAGIKLSEYEIILQDVHDEKQRRKIMKQAEDELDLAYGEELRNLTISQGKILIKLIDRETGSSTYDLVADLRGTFRAFFYQTFAKLFGYNLKVKYDPEGEDKEIELIVRMIESGQL